MNYSEIQSICERIKNYDSFSSLFTFDTKKEHGFVFDFSEDNEKLSEMNFSDPVVFNNYIFDTIKNNNSYFGIGKYGEKRIIYKQFDIFAKKDDARDIHLGLDLWVSAGEKVYAPVDGEVVWLQNDYEEGGYGGVVTLKHNIDGAIFYTLYGHLSWESINQLQIGNKIDKGKIFARVGLAKENGCWPPHLHFQIIVDLFDEVGVHPGVCSKKDEKYYLQICPDPNLILNIPNLT